MLCACVEEERHEIIFCEKVKKDIIINRKYHE